MLRANEDGARSDTERTCETLAVTARAVTNLRRKLNPLLVSIAELCAAPQQRTRQGREDIHVNAAPLVARDERLFEETPGDYWSFASCRVRREIFRLAVFL